MSAAQTSPRHPVANALVAQAHPGPPAVASLEGPLTDIIIPEAAAAHHRTARPSPSPSARVQQPPRHHTSTPQGISADLIAQLPHRPRLHASASTTDDSYEVRPAQLATRPHPRPSTSSRRSPASTATTASPTRSPHPRRSSVHKTAQSRSRPSAPACSRWASTEALSSTFASSAESALFAPATFRLSPSKTRSTRRPPTCAPRCCPGMVSHARPQPQPRHPHSPTL